MARRFGAGGNTLTVAAGQIPTTDQFTWLAIVRVDSLASAAVLFELTNAAGVSRIGLSTGGVLSETVSGSSSSWSGSFNVTATSGWCFIAVSKVASTTRQRCRIIYDTQTVNTGTATAFGAGTADAFTDVRIGATTTGASQWRAEIAALGMFSRAIASADDLTRYAYSLDSWLSLGPGAMWVFDQSAVTVPVIDWTGGGANQTARVGTSVSTSNVPVSYGHPVIIGTRSTAQNLFTTQTPAITDASDGTPGITTATSVRFSVDGTVSGVRFYSTTTVSGVYTVALWSVDSSDPGTGTLLASKTMTSAPAAGTWNSVNFDTAVSVNTTTLYRVGVFSGAGRYVAITNFAEFIGGSAGLTNGDIFGPPNGDNPVGALVINQGTFEINAAPTFPNDSGNATNYLVDVNFLPSAGGDVTGTLAAGLPALTAAAAGTVPVSGTAAVTLPALTGAATGSASTTGTATAGLPPLGATITGTVATAATITGTTPALTAAVSGGVSTSGTATAPLPALTAAVAGTVTGAPTTSSIVDTFDDGTLNASLWSGSYGGVTETGGRARIPCTTGFSALQTGNVYSLDSVFMRVWPPTAAGAGECYVDLLLYSAGQPGGTDLGIHIDAVSGQIVARSRVGYFDGTPVGVTYDPVAHAWLKIAVSGGDTLLQTSPDAVTWSTLRTVSTPVWLSSATDLSVNVESHRDTGTADFAEVDNVNTAAATGTVAAVLPALSGAAAGTVQTTGTAGAGLPALTGTAAGGVATQGTTAVVLPAMAGAVSGTTTATASITAGLPALTSAVTGTVDALSGDVTAVLPALAGTAIGTVTVTGSNTIVLPALVAATNGLTPVAAEIAVVLPALTASVSDAPIYVRRPGRFTTGSRRSKLTPGGHR